MNKTVGFFFSLKKNNKKKTTQAGFLFFLSMAFSNEFSLGEIIGEIYSKNINKLVV